MPHCLQNFLGGPDEEHFRLVHIEIEAKAGPAITQLIPRVRAAAAAAAAATMAPSSDAVPPSTSSTSHPRSPSAAPTQPAEPSSSPAEVVETGLVEIAAALRAMQGTLSRMGEKCDPYIYYHRVRLPMSGWKGNPALPQVRKSAQECISLKQMN